MVHRPAVGSTGGAAIGDRNAATAAFSTAVIPVAIGAIKPPGDSAATIASRLSVASEARSGARDASLIRPLVVAGGTALPIEVRARAGEDEGFLRSHHSGRPGEGGTDGGSGQQGRQGNHAIGGVNMRGTIHPFRDVARLSGGVDSRTDGHASGYYRSMTQASAAGHARWVRVSHWIVTLSVAVLSLFTGVEILMVHPRLYWGEVGTT